MKEYSLKTSLEGAITIVDAPQSERPSLQVPLRSISYKINVDGETEIELRREAVFHGETNPDFWPGTLFGKSSRQGVYTLRSYNSDTYRDIETTSEQLRENMSTLIGEIKKRWASGDNCPTGFDHSRNFWANGDLVLLEKILEKEADLPETVKEMIADLAGVEYKEW